MINKNIFIIGIHFGEQKGNCLHRGLKCAPDFSLQVTNNAICDVNNMEVCLDRIGAITSIGIIICSFLMKL